MDASEVSRAVATVVEEIRRRGDEALLEFTERWDGVKLDASKLRVPAEILERDPEESPFVEAFRRASDRIESFHAKVKPRSTMFEDDEGVWLGLRWTPIRSVGLYVPGGTASYPSTLAMTAIPARIAGCERIVVVSPPGPDGEVSPQVLMAAQVLGIDEVYRVGGSQAIAALAIGTESVPKVDKIFGPGNAFVAEAKQQLFGEVGIDLVAGPSEIVVYADESCEPDWVAADLMAQAEHDVDTGITLLASDRGTLDAIRSSVERQVVSEPREEIIRTALERGGRFEVVETWEKAADRINEVCPEHLSIQVRDPWKVLTRVRNAGAIFLGKESPVAVGDYYAGPNHVLPTGRTARFASCLSVEDFMKRSNVASMNLGFLRRRGADVEELATGERLSAHATSVRLRREGTRELRPRAGLASVTPYVLVEEDAEVKLNQNESPHDIPDDIKDEVASRLREIPWNRYQQKLPAELEATIASEAGVDARGVIVGTGSNLLLQWIFEAYAGPGRRVLYPDPSFSLYPLWCDALECEVATVPLTSDLQYDADVYIDRLRDFRPELCVLCLPNNPTGSEMATEDVRRIAEAAASHGGLLVIDEAYREFSGETFDRTALVKEYDNVLLLRTCSKAFSAAGARLGYAITNAAIGEELRKIVPPFHVSVFHAVLGQVLWSQKDVFETKIRELIRSRDELMVEVGAMPGVRVYPSRANFFLFRVNGAERIFDGLKERGILVRKPGPGALESCLRVNAGTPDENEKFLRALRELISQEVSG